MNLKAMGLPRFHALIAGRHPSTKHAHAAHCYTHATNAMVLGLTAMHEGMGLLSLCAGAAALGELIVLGFTILQAEIANG